ncbi:hypothetical protein [Rhodococcus sp. IEGM 1307]|uniref:alpha/beta hydrolase n=1 Tax=Rhodococcus sp. IEGM 1307 TaxID=3047091 RepID=UPI0024B72984|nr:hypothetical protein [Rhodococcus sp. IEGM 1307]MDI9978697.1 hypothetical protein [Rhodococcus sp. IEGM 1307]
MLYRPVQQSGDKPLLFYIHNGGMLAGNKWDLAARMAEWVEKHDCIAVGLEYRLAP